MKLIAIHTVHHRPDPKGEVVVVRAGESFVTTEEGAKYLIESGAARVDESAPAKNDDAGKQDSPAKAKKPIASDDLT